MNHGLEVLIGDFREAGIETALHDALSFDLSRHSVSDLGLEEVLPFRKSSPSTIQTLDPVLAEHEPVRGLVELPVHLQLLVPGGAMLIRLQH